MIDHDSYAVTIPRPDEDPYDHPLCRTLPARPLPAGQGMTDEQIEDAHYAYLLSLAEPK